MAVCSILLTANIINLQVLCIQAVFVSCVQCIGLHWWGLQGPVCTWPSVRHQP